MLLGCNDRTSWELIFHFMKIADERKEEVCFDSMLVEVSFSYSIIDGDAECANCG